MQYNDDQRYGLSILWNDQGNIKVSLWKNNMCLAEIGWTSNWTEYVSYNPSVFDGVVSIDDFRSDAEKKE